VRITTYIWWTLVSSVYVRQVCRIIGYGISIRPVRFQFKMFNPYAMSSVQVRMLERLLHANIAKPASHTLHKYSNNRSLVIASLYFTSDQSQPLIPEVHLLKYTSRTERPELRLPQGETRSATPVRRDQNWVTRPHRPEVLPPSGEIRSWMLHRISRNATCILNIHENNFYIIHKYPGWAVKNARVRVGLGECS
jgi:hypothetical protein